MKIFGLVDCNSFFASCEKVFHPEWEKRPVVVLSNNDGCVVARSPEAKELLIPMGMPWFQLRESAARNGVVVCSGNYSLYGDMSRRVMQTLAQWTPDMEIYSVDEAFLDLSGQFPELVSGKYRNSSGPMRSCLRDLCQKIVAIVPQWTGIPVSLGIGQTKTLAKVANRIAKKRADRYSILLEEQERIDQLQGVPLEDVWGVGQSLLPKFQRLGLKNAYDLSLVDPVWMGKNFSCIQEKLVRELRGEPCLNLEEEVPPKQNMQVSRSFGHPIEVLSELEKAISTFAAKGAEKLRRQKSVASAIHVQLYTNVYRRDRPQAFPGMALPFPVPTNSSLDIIAQALKILRIIYKKDYAYKKAMILLLSIVDEKVVRSQKTLFELDPDKPQELRDKERCLMETLDTLNRSLGKGRLFFASEGVQKNWTPNANFVSPCYTTRWEDIPVVYAK